MFDRVKQLLAGLRGSLSDRAEDAYVARDEAPANSRAEAFAAGEAHAYGEAEGQVRAAEKAAQA